MSVSDVYQSHLSDIEDRAMEIVNAVKAEFPHMTTEQGGALLHRIMALVDDESGFRTVSITETPTMRVEQIEPPKWWRDAIARALREGWW